jgi:beta-lactamase regulating signal transducer with metallopeptidase domain
MTGLTHWISPRTMEALGWALVHFLWQGAALAALAASLMVTVRRPSARYVIGVVTLGVMLLAPVATFLFYSQSHSSSVEGLKTAPRTTAARPLQTAKTQSAPAQPSHTFSLNAFPWLVEVWLFGVALFSLRSAGGFVLLERQRRRESTVVEDRLLQICHALQHQLGITRAVRFCESAVLQAPAVIGWFRPIVFLPATALTGLSEEQLRLVIAHELAHIRRYDAFVNLFQVSAETLLFYHPAVWWLNRRIRAEREHCCDETAVALCGNAVEYARALTLMEEWRNAPVFAMAANRGPLSERVRHLLGVSSGRENGRKIGFGGSVLFLVTALSAGNALLGIAYPKSVSYMGSGPIPRLVQSETTSPQAEQKPAPAQSAKPSAAPAAKSSPAPSPKPTEQPLSAQSYIDGMKSAGLNDLTADDLIGLKIQGVTPEYVRAMHDLGLHPDADGLIGMKVQGVTPEYVKELRGLGFNPDVDQIVGMKVQGVTAEYVRGMKELGIQGDADQIVGMKVQGVTPDYVRELQALRLKLDGDDIVGMKVQGVTPAYVKGLRDLGLNPGADDIVGMKVQGVTPEYIRDIRALGLNPSTDDIVGMKVQGVTADYIKALQSAGFKPNADEVIDAKVQGITPEFIDLAHKHGFQNLTIDKLIQLKHLGILDSKGEI